MATRTRSYNGFYRANASPTTRAAIASLARQTRSTYNHAAKLYIETANHRRQPL